MSESKQGPPSLLVTFVMDKRIIPTRHTVSSPEEALLMTEMGLIEVVLTDALMPGMDGRELCRRVKEFGHFQPP